MANKLELVIFNIFRCVNKIHRPERNLIANLIFFRDEFTCVNLDLKRKDSEYLHHLIKKTVNYTQFNNRQEIITIIKYIKFKTLEALLKKKS